MHRIVRSFALAAALWAGAPSAQNLVVNGGFDANTAGWQLDGAGQISWSPQDAQGQPASGSLLLVNGSPATGFGTNVRQCIPVQPGARYALSARALVPGISGQSLVNQTRPGYRFHSSAGCGAPLSGQIDLFNAVTAFDQWQRGGPTLLTAPGNAVAVELRGLISKLVDGTTPAGQFDDFEFVLMDPFASGFE